MTTISTNILDIKINYLISNTSPTLFCWTPIKQTAKDLDDLNNYPNANKVLDKVFFVGAAPHYTDEVFDYIGRIWVSRKNMTI